MPIPSWYMKREWLDQEPGIEAVYMHYTWTPLGHGPDWSQHWEARPLEKHATLKEGIGGTILVDLCQSEVKERPAKSPDNARVRVIKLPTGIWDPQTNTWSEEFLFHHYFEIHQNGSVWNTELFTEVIVSRDVEYVDWDGNVVGTCAHWSVFDFDAPQYCPSEIPEFIERFGLDNEFRSDRFYTYPDRSYYFRSKALMLREIPLPHRWRSKVWGPRGAKVVQGWHVGYLDQIPAERERVQMREEWAGYGEFSI